MRSGNRKNAANMTSSGAKTDKMTTVFFDGVMVVNSFIAKKITESKLDFRRVGDRRQCAS
jgi:hypothetical protein